MPIRQISCRWSLCLLDGTPTNRSQLTKMQIPCSRPIRTHGIRVTNPSQLCPHRAIASQARSRHVTAAMDTILKPITNLGKVQDLKQGIASFYDQSSGLWEEMWGEHMHHGYYPKGTPPKSHQQAQIDMVDESLSWAGVTHVTSMVDVGCGIGGSSRHIMRRWPGAKAQGITLSPKQAQRANEITQKAGLPGHFQVGDALAQPFDDNSFDLVWSMESGEHMPDKRQFVGELARVCAPGGRVLVVTWCHRILGENETTLKPQELALLERINEAYYLPDWCSAADYAKLFEEAGMRDIRVADWSEEVTPFWTAVIQSALTGAGLMGLMKAGWTTIKGALVMPLMATGFQMGLIKFNLITAQKP